MYGATGVPGQHYHRQANFRPCLPGLSKVAASTCSIRRSRCQQTTGRVVAWRHMTAEALAACAPAVVFHQVGEIVVHLTGNSAHP